MQPRPAGNHGAAGRNTRPNFAVTSIRCPLLAGLSVHETGGDRHSEQRNEEIDVQQNFHDSIRC